MVSVMAPSGVNLNDTMSSATNGKLTAIGTSCSENQESALQEKPPLTMFAQVSIPNLQLILPPRNLNSHLQKRTNHDHTCARHVGGLSPDWSTSSVTNDHIQKRSLSSARNVRDALRGGICC